MIKLSALFWLILVSATGFAMFAVKYEVQSVADQLAQTTKRADDADRDIRVLDAEWAYLNRPDALAQMNQRYLSLTPIATKQLIANIGDIPLRPVPPPAVEHTVAVAESPPSQNPLPQSASPVSSTVLAEQPAEGQTSVRQSSFPRRTAERGAPVLTAALETRGPTSEPARPVLIKAAATSSSAHRAKSLDELIAQIAESR
jgi:cell division protein FtsL